MAGNGNLVSRANDALARAQAAEFASRFPQAAQQLSSATLASQLTVFNLPYWSTSRFRAVRTGAGPFTFTMAAGVRKAFSTKVGGVGDSAGFASGFVITEAETNLLNENNTRNNESLEIIGISAEIDALASPSIVAWLFRYAFLSVQLGSDSTIPLGKLSMFPQAGGMFGSSPDPLELPALGDTQFIRPFATNGNPQNANYFKLDVPIKWNGVNEGSDTNFNIITDVKQAFTKTTTDRAGATGVAAFTSPADGAVGTYADITFRLHGRRIGQRGVNV